MLVQAVGRVFADGWYIAGPGCVRHLRLPKSSTCLHLAPEGARLGCSRSDAELPLSSLDGEGAMIPDLLVGQPQGSRFSTQIFSQSSVASSQF